MIRLGLLVEGHTEEAFAKTVLKGHLAQHNVYVSVRRVETGRHRIRRAGRTDLRISRGGLKNYQKVRNDLVRWLREDRNADARFSTMFDLYRLPHDFPGYEESRRKGSPRDKIEWLETCFGEDIHDSRFVPYIQLHEFEALLLSDASKFDRWFDKHDRGIRRLLQLCVGFTSPEEIDDGDETAPSKRIAALIPAYRDAKPIAGPIIAQAIGLTTIRQQCPHFDAWLTRLEQLDAASGPCPRT